ncbi:hypothetical protein HY409_00620 [Candidatus Gottesmanbacteria bacterium]|nr:hypothetical protein [Candidatus Gottesmanbacteria bacterium]
MNRDALLATVIGFGIGLFITGGFLYGPTLIKSLPQVHMPTLSLPVKSKKPSPTPLPNTLPETLTISSPLSESIESKSETLVSGVTVPESTVIILGALDETVIQGNSDGTYAGKVMLTEGRNDLTIISYHDNNEQSQKVTVFYTPEEF